jgi:hypothetical protein
VKKLLTTFAAVTAIAVLAGCGDPATAPAASPATKSAALKSSPYPSPKPSPEPVALTKANFAPKVLAALKAKRTFRAVIISAYGPHEVFTVDLRLLGGRSDMSVSTGQLRVVRIGQVIYMTAPNLTVDPKRPWVKLALDSDDPALAARAKVVNALLNQMLVHQMLGGARHSVSFKQEGNLKIDDVPTLAYRFGVDVRKAAAADSLGHYLNARQAKTLKRVIDVNASVDEANLPRETYFVLADEKDREVRVRATFSRFGENLTIAAPPKALIGKIRQRADPLA